jgi:hypothetical protein
MRFYGLHLTLQITHYIHSLDLVIKDLVVDTDKYLSVDGELVVTLQLVVSTQHLRLMYY